MRKYLVCSCVFFLFSVVVFNLDETILRTNGIEKSNLIIGLCIASLFFLIEGLDLDRIFKLSSNNIVQHDKMQSRDERCITIEKYSKAETYEMLSRLMIVSIFILIILGKVNKLAICIWVVIILGCEVGRILYKKKLESKMINF